MSTNAGIAAELLFSHECLLKGYIVSYPIGNFAPYDVIIDNGKKLLKIQVKRASKPDVTITAKKHIKSERFSDIFAYGIYYNNQWLIIPKKDMPKTRNIHLGKKFIEKYKNNWKILNPTKDAA